MLAYIFTSLQATPKDIEELCQAGQEADTCPYFGSRRAIPQAQVCHSSSLYDIVPDNAESVVSAAAL